MLEVSLLLLAVLLDSDLSLLHKVLEGNNEDAKRSIIKTAPHPEAKEDWVAAFYVTFQNLVALSKKYR